MFVINPLDTRPGEAELLAASAAYFADRLFTKRQRQILHITLNITSQPIRVPVARDMLTVQRGLLRNYAPRVFVFSASVAPGMRDAMEVIAHEMIHHRRQHRQLVGRPYQGYFETQCRGLGNVAHQVSKHWLQPCTRYRSQPHQFSARLCRR